MYSLDVAQWSLGGCLKVTKTQCLLQGSGEFWDVWAKHHSEWWERLSRLVILEVQSSEGSSKKIMTERKKRSKHCDFTTSLCIKKKNPSPWPLALSKQLKAAKPKDGGIFTCHPPWVGGRPPRSMPFCQWLCFGGIHGRWAAWGSDLKLMMQWWCEKIWLLTEELKNPSSWEDCWADLMSRFCWLSVCSLEHWLWGAVTLIHRRF